MKALLPSNVARQGFVPAGNGRSGRSDRRFMLIPKPREQHAYIPPLRDNELSWLAGRLGPADRRALREIAETGDLVTQDGKTYLVARVSSATIDALAAFEAEAEDRENDLCDEPQVDDEPDFDNEPSIC